MKNSGSEKREGGGGKHRARLLGKKDTIKKGKRPHEWSERK